MQSNVAGERGETSLQSVILVPVIFLLFFMCFHIGVLLHKGHVAEAVALRGAEISSSGEISERNTKNARVEMTRMAQELGSQVVGIPLVSYEGLFVAVTVSIRVNGVVPFLPKVTTATVRQTMERFIQEQDRE